MTTSNPEISELTIVRKISLDYAKTVKSHGWDLYKTVMDDITNADLHYYPIGDSQHYVVLNTLDACILAYAYKEPVQKYIDRHADAFLMQKDPNAYGMQFMQKMKNAVSGYTSRYSRQKFCDAAIRAATDNPDLIRPKASKIHVKFLYEGNDGKYHEKLSDNM